MSNEILYILLPDYAAHEAVYLSQAIVPPTIAAYVADNYSVTGINEISRDNRGYEVELNTGVELIFDRDGKFVRIDR